MKILPNSIELPNPKSTLKYGLGVLKFCQKDKTSPNMVTLGKITYLGPAIGVSASTILRARV